MTNTKVIGDINLLCKVIYTNNRNLNIQLLLSHHDGWDSPISLKIHKMFVYK